MPTTTAPTPESASSAVQLQRATAPISWMPWKMPTTPTIIRSPLTTNAAFMNGAVGPRPRPLIGWLNATTIASALFMSPATMSQRLVRAKHKIKHAGIPFRIPEREELTSQLDAVLDAIYVTFAEGWTDPGGTDVARRDLAEEALFLGSLVAELLPQQPEALGLLALMLHAEARRRARRNA